MRHLALVLCLLLLAAPFARADQTDPALDTLFEKLQGPDAAPRAAETTQQIWGIWLDAGNEKINERLETGIIAMNAGYLEVAEEVFGEVVTKAPEFAEGWNKRATVRYFMGDHAGSIADCAKVLELEPRHFGALAGRGLTFLQQGRQILGQHAIRDALKVHPWLNERRLLPPDQKI